MARALARNCGEHVTRALGDDATAAQEHEAIADLGRIGDLMDGQEERAIRRNMLAQRGGGFAALAQIQALERFVDQEYRLGGEQPEREQGAFALPFGQSADRHAHQWCQGEIGDHLLVDLAAAAKETEAVFQHPAHRLVRPGSDAVRDIKQLGGTMPAISRRIAERDIPTISGLQTGHAFE